MPIVKLSPAFLAGLVCPPGLRRIEFCDSVVPGLLIEHRSAADSMPTWYWRRKVNGKTAYKDLGPLKDRRIVVPLPDSDPKDVARRHRRYGDFSKLNRTWNHARSDTTHERLTLNLEEWEQYHTLYRAARQDWAAVPFEEMIRWGQQRSGYVIGDFGCGEALLGKALADRHTVYSVDHVAVDGTVTACDMAHVPLDDETLDVAIFCLSLMGSNFADYLAEAYRTLKLDGQLHVWEATSRFGLRETFAKNVTRLGFDLVKIEDKWKFTHLQFLKADRRPEVQVVLAFQLPATSAPTSTFSAGGGAVSDR